MKHLLLLAILLASITSATAQRGRMGSVPTGDTTDATFDLAPRRDLVMVSLYDLVHFYNLSYLHSVAPEIAIGGGFRLAHGLGGTPGGSSIAMGFTMEARFYPERKGVEGVYFAPHVSINRLLDGVVLRDYDPGTGGSLILVNRIAGMGFSIGAMAGWQYFPWEELTLGVGIGFEHHILAAGTTTTGTRAPFQEYDGINRPRVRFDIGYAW
jgi:hypothetical protein